MQLSGKLFALIEAVLKAAEHKPADAALRDALRSAAIDPIDRTVVSRSVFTYFRWFGWLDRSAALRAQLKEALELADRFAANARSFSDSDLVERTFPAWIHDCVKVTAALAREFQKEPRLWLRARPGTGAELSRALAPAEPHSVVSDAIWYKGEADLYHTSEFRSGRFEIQDLSSQVVGHLCAPNPGETWWDACAGEGGKTLHLCDLMQNKGTVWASDPARWRLDILKRRAARARLFNYRLKPWTPGGQLPTKTRFDGILVDAPCSGLGTWGRNPHARWTAKPEDVPKLAALQSDLLHKVAGSLKPGGKLTYSVCTMTHAETREVSQLFSATHPSFVEHAAQNPLRPDERTAEFELHPPSLHANGMFIRLWQHNG